MPGAYAGLSLDVNDWMHPERISIEEDFLSGAGASFSETVPKHSLTVIELDVQGLSVFNGPVVCGTV